MLVVLIDDVGSGASLSGHNHHAIGMGGITEMAISAPGFRRMYG